jgi:NADH:ubiquinone oxidoreductase subunit E
LMLTAKFGHVQLVKIYMPCNFEVNLITRLGVIAFFSSFFSSPDPKGHVRYCHHLASVVRPLTFSYFNLLL